MKIYRYLSEEKTVVKSEAIIETKEESNEKGESEQYQQMTEKMERNLVILIFSLWNGSSKNISYTPFYAMVTQVIMNETRFLNHHLIK